MAPITWAWCSSRRVRRSIDPADAKALAAKARGRAKVVALLVDPEDALIEAVVKLVEPDMLQLHGEETAERLLPSAAAGTCRSSRPSRGPAPPTRVSL